MMDETSPKFSIGQLVQHKLFNYRGVIIDVDPTSMTHSGFVGGGVEELGTAETIAELTSGLLILKHSRAHEREADRIGVEKLARAGRSIVLLSLMLGTQMGALLLGELPRHGYYAAVSLALLHLWWLTRDGFTEVALYTLWFLLMSAERLYRSKTVRGWLRAAQ